jgi:prepilin-type N-terminal cleavage/methylation domain-containing protein
MRFARFFAGAAQLHRIPRRIRRPDFCARWHSACVDLVVIGFYPSTKAARAHKAEPGFSLIEVLVTVVIITIISAIALPVLGNGMKDRRTRHAAEEIARVFREARMRAIGRGSAVLVHYVGGDTIQSFEVREAIAGPSPFNSGDATCSLLPATSCSTAKWTNAATPGTLGSQNLETYTIDFAAGTKVILELPGSASAVTDYSVCFTPLGRTLATQLTPPDFATSSQPMTSVPTFRVYRTLPGDTARVGLERRVVLLPNGQARLQTALGSSP